uniref:Sushi domain-containing protein n=1 Tax=Magallana gigas TaxID=29159 RepID=A0A8W8MYX4_MAGGI
MGFIPDVLQLLQTYQLTDYLNTWLSDGSFPSKSAWKSTVRSSVNTHQTLQRIERTAYDPDFFRFNAIFSTSNPFIMWQYINSYSEIQNLKFTFKFIASKPLQTSIAFVLYGHFVTDVFSHATISCPALTMQHSNWWNSLTRSFTVHLEAELSGLPEDNLFLILLGKQTLTVLSQAEEIEFRKLNSRLLARSITDSLDCGIPNRTGIDLSTTHREDAIGIHRRIHASCIDGYYQFGSGRLICQSNGEWKYDIVCEEGWAQYENHVYRLFTEPKNWESAKDHCESLDAYLVEIESLEENNWVYDKILDVRFLTRMGRYSFENSNAPR